MRCGLKIVGNCQVTRDDDERRGEENENFSFQIYGWQYGMGVRTRWGEGEEV